MVLKKIKKKLKSRLSRGNPAKDAQQVLQDLEFNYIMLVGDIRTAEPPVAVCTCGDFKQGIDEDHKSLMSIGREAKKHAQETGHQLRQHDLK